MNEIRKINCGRDKWLEGKREEVSSLESEIKRDKTKINISFWSRRKEKEEEEEEEDHRYGIRVWIHGLEPSILCMVWVWELLNSFRVGLSRGEL